MRLMLRQLCVYRSYLADELALSVGRNPRYLKECYLASMLRAGERQ